MIGRALPSSPVTDKRLAVLAVQEAHLTPERIDNLNELFASSLLILGSPDPENGAGARGVAFAINKRYLAGRDCKMDVLVPGRAASIAFPWTKDKFLHITNIYAPNATQDNAAFWVSLETTWAAPGRPRPDVMLGDFNMVENARDRIPERADPDSVTRALTSLLVATDLQDSWREAHPNERVFTFRQARSASQSRLDRIYVKRALRNATADWDVDSPGPLSDHLLVSLSIANYHAPHVGTGRWKIPLSILDDPVFMKSMRELGLELKDNLNNLVARSDEENPQTIFHTFKTKLANAARTRAKQWMPKIDQKIAALKEQQRAAQNPARPNGGTGLDGWRENRTVLDAPECASKGGQHDIRATTTE
ncbi:DNase I-like protein [Trametes versicolor FP-101664 SS1]|uniref:DNase I-like protein n=1 Tax=Trametes versicolor (strain FP-101664) TaxID=717944 RepID=UPI0004623246|nr:DNase I-like protein [Trametes versicolor FP-101664 SS1]EIW56836.1 DNase I-like protein [Trametes versicolor FP-101664 SS1]